MRIDAALLDRAIELDLRLPILRVYRWDAPALSLGLHQQLSDELLGRCTGLGVEIVRRPTGGSAVLHGGDLTYAVVAPSGNRGVIDAYHWVAGGLIEGLAQVGVDARVGARDGGPGSLMLDSRAACFAATAAADLQVGEAKICGSAQIRHRGWFLQHGSIPITDNRVLTRRLLRHPGANNSTCIETLCPGTTWEQLAGCLIGGFESLWGRSEELKLDDLKRLETIG
jgi:lipoate-protein ligase A